MNAGARVDHYKTSTFQHRVLRERLLGVAVECVVPVQAVPPGARSAMAAIDRQGDCLTDRISQLQFFLLDLESSFVNSAS